MRPCPLVSVLAVGGGFAPAFGLSAADRHARATVATGTTREYIWLPETEIAPTRADAGGHPKRHQSASRTSVDRPLAVVDAVNGTTPATWWVSVDHLNRPVRMTTSAKALVWDAVWQPLCARGGRLPERESPRATKERGVHAITGSASLDARFPGQWFQLETGLHYNWHRSYDPTVGRRYTQPDPLGFVDGPSIYGYAKGSPQVFVDPDGLRISANTVRKLLEACLVAYQVLTGTKATTRVPPSPPPITRPASTIQGPPKTGGGTGGSASPPLTGPGGNSPPPPPTSGGGSTPPPTPPRGG